MRRNKKICTATIFGFDYFITSIWAKLKRKKLFEIGLQKLYFSFFFDLKYRIEINFWTRDHWQNRVLECYVFKLFLTNSWLQFKEYVWASQYSKLNFILQIIHFSRFNTIKNLFSFWMDLNLFVLEVFKPESCFPYPLKKLLICLKY